MITFLIMIIVATLVFLLMWYERENIFACLFTGIVMAFCLMVLTVITTTIIVNYFDLYTIEENKICDIVSLQSQNVVHGSFALGCGTINEKEYYFVMSKIGNGGYRRKTFDTSKTIIFETNNTSYISSVSKTLKNKLWIYDSSILEYRIYVPTNTIIRQFIIK